MGHYILDEHNQPEHIDDLMCWAMWFEKSDRTIAKTNVGDTLVSTVFLGIDHNFDEQGLPVLFETMVFGGALDEYQERYTSAEEAEWGHEQIVKRVKGEGNG